MGKQLQYRRLLLLGSLLGGAFAVLACRLVEVQVIRHDELRVKAEHVRKIVLPPRRGDILDAKGQLLATSVFVKTICADPTLVSNYQAVVARTIAPILQLDEREVYQKLQPQTLVNSEGVTVPDKYVVLKNKVPIETWERVRSAMTNLTFGVDEKKLNRKERKFFSELRTSAIFPNRVDEQVRNYPSGSLAAHVIGFLARDELTNSPTSGEMVGADGIERFMQEKLAGTAGSRITEVDARSREVVSLRRQEIAVRDGYNVVLTIDSFLQQLLEDSLAEGMKKHTPLNISGIVVRPQTGEILAMATSPNFNPGDLKGDLAARRNRVISDATEPGSTFKIVPVSAALNDRTVSLNDVFDCENGRFWFAGHSLKDDHKFGRLSVEEIITKSSNIGAAKIGIKMGSRRLYEYMGDYGFGARTGIPLPFESPGISHRTEKWSKVSIAQIPMGHGVAVTRLQMVMAMSAIANNGRLMRPFLVNRLEDGDAKIIAQYKPEMVRQVVSEATAKQMVQALKTVVAKEGTAEKAALDNYTVAGKTGTAQKTIEGVKGYAPGKHIASFIGFFPADNPELCISIVLDEPKQGYYGGQTAAPVFHDFATAAANYLKIRPDRTNASPVLVSAANLMSGGRSFQSAPGKESRNP
jgi:cell division protein FtsI/penicillin-binding protein 2